MILENVRLIFEDLLNIFFQYKPFDLATFSPYKQTNSFGKPT